MAVILRCATVADAEGLARLAARTFRETFGPHNREDDMAAYLAQTYNAERQRRELGDPSYVTLLLDVDGAPAAFAQVRRSEAPPAVAGERAVEIYRFYVDAAHHGAGLAQQLMAAAEEVARELGGATLWLGVWEHNARAIRFYVKCGFRDVGSTPFLLGSDLQTDRLMAKPLLTQA